MDEHSAGPRPEQSFAPAFEAALKAADTRSWIAPAPHRTFAWYALRLESDLIALIAREEITEIAKRKNRRYRTLAMEAFRVLHAHHAIGAALPLGQDILMAAYHALDDPGLARQIVFYLRPLLRDYLDRLDQTGDEAEALRITPARKRRAYRSRDELPDPNLPAWAPVNRRPDAKVQMPVRIDAGIKDAITEAAQARGLSNARWIASAIVLQLQREGFAVSLDTPYAGPPDEDDRRAKRIQRAKGRFPAPEKTRHSSVNRADKSTGIRISAPLAEAIDTQLGEEEDRSAWFNAAARAFLKSRARLPPPPKTRETYSVPVSLRFERDFFFRVEKAAEKAGLTVSDWLRRVAHWQLTQI